MTNMSFGKDEEINEKCRNKKSRKKMRKNDRLFCDLRAMKLMGRGKYTPKLKYWQHMGVM